MTTGERIKECRKRLGMSAEILAAKISVSPATVYRWEKGDIEKVPAKILEPLAEVLQTTPKYLLGWEETEEEDKETITIKNDDVRLLAAGLDKMSEADRRRATEMFNLMFELNMDFFRKGKNDDDA